MTAQVADKIRNLLDAMLDTPPPIRALVPVGGGDAAQAWRVELADGRRYFCKYAAAATAAQRDRFAIERRGLELLAAPDAFIVPRPLAHDTELLVLQWLDLGRGGSAFEEKFGRALARLQHATRSVRFGFERDNWLGGSVQVNDWHDDWTAFWDQCRLGPQLAILRERLGADDALVRALATLRTRLPALLAGAGREAVLLHGDLWSGNVAADPDDEPVILDPAAYYGDREAEFGMLRLFGGMSSRMEAAYAELWPFEPGFQERLPLYRLHHELNHLILFGASYHAMSLASARALL